MPKGKLANGQPKYIVKSHIREKSLDKISASLKRLIRDIEFPTYGKHSEYDAICKYNSYVMGIHEYYRLATMVAYDLVPISFSVQKSLKNRLRKRVKTAKEVKKKRIPCKIPNIIRERYGASAQMRYVGKCALVPIGFIQHKNPMCKIKSINSYKASGRAVIHKSLEKVNMDILHFLMRNPIPNRSIEYNDNRLSLYSAQMGKCAVTGRIMTVGNIYCHHRVPRHMGGTDAYKNLVLVCEDVHYLIHATNPDTIAKYMESLRLTSKQLKTLSKLRSLVHVENC